MSDQEIQDWIASRTELDEIIDAICYAARYDDFDEIDEQKQKIELLISKAKKEAA